MKPRQQITRRSFCLSAATATASLGIFAAPNRAMQRTAFYKNPGPGHVGVRANQQQTLDYAATYGFDSITPAIGEFEKKSDAEIHHSAGHGIRRSSYLAGAVPLSFRLYANWDDGARRCHRHGQRGIVAG